MTSGRPDAGAVSNLQRPDEETSEGAARWWPLVTHLAWAGAALSAGMACLLEPSLAARLLSADGRLEQTSQSLLRAMQVAFAAGAVLLFLIGRHSREHSARNERLVLGLLFAAGATVISILLCEAGLRAASNIRPLTAERHFFFLHDELLGWRHRPGAVARFKDALVRINSVGLRDEEMAPGGASSEFRILFLGDSQVFGDGVEATETFVDVLERQFSGVQAINAGVIGYGTDQQLLYYEREGASLGPRVTVVGLNAYDLRDNLSDRVRSGYLKPRFELAAGQLRLVNVPVPAGSIVDRLQRRLRSQSYLYTFLNREFSPRRTRSQDAEGDPLEVYPSDARIASALAITGQLLGKLAVSVDKHGGRLVVVFLPYEMDFAGDVGYVARSDRLVRMLDDTGREAHFLAWDLRPYLNPDGDLYLDTMHFSREGHRQVAAALKSLFVQQGVIPAAHAR